MADYDIRLEQAANKAEVASEQLHDFVNGPDTGTISTESGPLPTLAKFIADEKAIVEAQVAEAAADVAAAKTAAESARDAAIIGAGVYVDEPTGRAAVADGVAFKVQGSGDVAAYEYRRVNAGSSTLVATYPAADIAIRAGAVRGSYPFISGLTSANAGGSASLLPRLLKGVIDIRLYGLSTADTYYIERLRRNYSSNWHIVVKRSSDNATVLQHFAAITEPADPTVPMNLYLGGIVAGASGYIRVRWSSFESGVINTGLTMTLHPDCLNRGAVSDLNALPFTAARLGHITMPTNVGEYASVNESTRTFTWPELRIPDARANSAGYFKLQAGSVTFDANYQVAWLDLIEAASYGYGTIPNTAVKKAVVPNSVNFGNEAYYYAGAHQYPLAFSPGAGRVDVNPLIRFINGSAGTAYSDDIVIKVDQANNIVSVYMRANGSSAASLTYIHYRLYHHVAANADVWTIDGIWEVSRSGYESFTTGKEIVVSQVELLCALQEQGASDFMGGRAHGDEVITQAPTLLIDGCAVSVTSGSLAWYHGKEVTFIQKSKLYRDGSLATALSVPLADRKLWLTFRDGDMVADQRIEHLASYTLIAGYLAMLAPHRYETYVGGVSENNASAQISGYYADNVRMIPMDASARQAGPVADDYVYGTTPPVTMVKLWGSYGVECTMDVLESSAAILKNLMYVNRTSYAYNKAYIGFIAGYSGNQAVTTADKWQIKTRWSFRSKN